MIPREVLKKLRKIEIHTARLANTQLAGFRGESTLKPWLFSITTRVALDHLRANRRWDKQVMIDACDERGASSVAEKYGDRFLPPDSLT